MRRIKSLCSKCSSPIYICHQCSSPPVPLPRDIIIRLYLHIIGNRKHCNVSASNLQLLVASIHPLSILLKSPTTFSRFFLPVHLLLLTYLNIVTRRHYYYTKWQHKKTEEKKKTIHEASCERLSYSSPTPPPLLVLPPDVSSQDKLRRNGKLCHTIFAPESKLTMLSTDFYRRTHARSPLIEHGQRHQP